MSTCTWDGPMFALSLDLLLISDDGGHVMAANGEAERVFACTTGSQIERLVHPRSVSTMRNLVEEALRDGVSQQVLNVIASGKEHELWAEVIRIETHPPRLHWRFRSFDERSLLRAKGEPSKADQQVFGNQLRDSNSRLQLLVKASPLPIIMLDFEGRVLHWNPAAEELFGWSESEVLGQHPPGIAADQFQLFMHLFPRIRSGMKLRDREMNGRHRDGTTLFLSAFASLVYGADGKANGIAAILTDVGEQRRLQEEAERRNVELNTVSRIISALSATIRLPEVIAALVRELCELENAAGAVFMHEPGRGWHAASEWELSERQITLLSEILQTNPPRADGEWRPVLPSELMLPQAPLVLPLFARDSVCGALVLFPPTGSPFGREQNIFYRTLSREIGFALENARIFEELQATNQQLRELSRAVVTAQETERRRIALELHDQVGQILTGLKFTIETVGRTDSADNENLLARAEQILAELMEQIRSLSLDLRPAGLDELGLLAALQRHFDRYASQTGIQLKFDHWGIDDRRFPMEIETTAFRVVQEALTNVARHAAADKVAVRAWATNETLCLQIEDTGVGFEPGTTLPQTDRIGLGGIRERASLLGGQLRIDSEPGTGTFLMVELPIATEGEAENGA